MEVNVIRITAADPRGAIIQNHPTYRPFHPDRRQGAATAYCRWLPLLPGGQGPRIAHHPPRAHLRALSTFPLRPEGRRLLLLAAEPAPVAPTPQEFEEEAAKAALEPTEAQREAGYCRKGQINIGDLDITIETAMGAEEKFSDLFFPTRGKRILMGKVYQSYWTGNRWRPIVDRFGCGASFFGIMPGCKAQTLRPHELQLFRWMSRHTRGWSHFKTDLGRAFSVSKADQPAQSQLPREAQCPVHSGLLRSLTSKAIEE